MPISIKYDDLVIENGVRADLVIEDSVVIELISVELVKPVHKKQLLTYLSLSRKKLGLLINFGDSLLKKWHYLNSEFIVMGLLCVLCVSNELSEWA